MLGAEHRSALFLMGVSSGNRNHIEGVMKDFAIGWSDGGKQEETRKTQSFISTRKMLDLFSFL